MSAFDPDILPREPDRGELLERYTEIARLAGGLAHEIKNPLSTIRLNMELLAEDFSESDDPKTRRSLRKIETVQRECQRLQDLLDDFLSFAKVRRLKQQPTVLNEQVKRTAEFFRPRANEAGVELVDYLTGDLPTVLLDREAFHGALLNLLINAEQALNGEPGQIILKTYFAPEGVGLDVIDTGPGMDKETRSKVFEAFFSTKGGGSGLGLPTTRKIIEAHGGSIRIQSEPGCGTQFTIRLPVPPRLAAGDG